MLTLSVFAIAVLTVGIVGYDLVRRRAQRRGRWWDWEHWATAGFVLAVLTVWNAFIAGWTAAITGGFAAACFVVAIIAAKSRWTGPLRERRRRD